MKKRELLNLANSLSTNVLKNVNTNYGWGFGGAIKTVYTLPDNFSIHSGKAYYRHLSPSVFVNLRDSDGSIVSERIDAIYEHLVSLQKNVLSK